MILLAFCRSALNGEINAVSTIKPASFISFATYAVLLIFSIRSSGSKPRFLFSPILMLSPSRSIVYFPLRFRRFSISFANADFPDPESPVNHNVIGFCPILFARNLRVISSFCHVMLSDLLKGCLITPQAEVIFVTDRKSVV